MTDYFGRFPVKQLNIALIPVPGREVQSGWVFGGKHPIINVHIGENIDRQAVQNDWVMVHEMVHLAFPDVEQRWIEEGIATYVESVSRASMGDLSARYVWRELIKRMPQGQPQSGDRGLDRTPTWGRTYWGGAMFCLVADVEIRRRTDNRYGLKDALRAILGADYNMNHQAELADVLSAGDEGVGVSVLTELYNRHKYEPIPFDLEGIWQNLGVELSGLSVKYNSDAPMGEVRRKIMPDS